LSDVRQGPTSHLDHNDWHYDTFICQNFQSSGFGHCPKHF